MLAFILNQPIDDSVVPNLTFNKISNTDVIVKIQGYGQNSSNIIELSSLELFNDDSRTFDGYIVISRNNETILTINAGASPSIDMMGSLIPPDNNQHGSDIKIETFGIVQGWLKLRKIMR